MGTILDDLLGTEEGDSTGDKILAGIDLGLGAFGSFQNNQQLNDIPGFLTTTLGDFGITGPGGTATSKDQGTKSKVKLSKGDRKLRRLLNKLTKGGLKDAIKGGDKARNRALKLSRAQAAPFEKDFLIDTAEDLFNTGRLGTTGGGDLSNPTSTGSSAFAFVGDQDFKRQLAAGDQGRAFTKDALGRISAGLKGTGDLDSRMLELLAAAAGPAIAGGELRIGGGDALAGFFSNTGGGSGGTEGANAALMQELLEKLLA